MFYSNEIFLDDEVRSELLIIRSEIIEKCSEIVHHDYESVSGPNLRDSLRFRNVIHFPVTRSILKSEGKIYRYVYDEYKFPYLVELIDRILKGDFTALIEILNINYEKELKPIQSKIDKASKELDMIDNLNIKDKRKKLDELEAYLEQLEYNKKQKSVILYYERVIDILGIKREKESDVYVPKLAMNG